MLKIARAQHGLPIASSGPHSNRPQSYPILCSATIGSRLDLFDTKVVPQIGCGKRQRGSHKCHQMATLP